jgi:urease accessory protein
VISRSVAVVARGGRVPTLASQPPWTLRQVHADEPGCAALCMVGAAAGPLAGDDLELRLEVRDDARAQLGATGATLAQGRHEGRPASLRTSVRVGAGAVFVGAPAPLIVCAGSHVAACLEIDLDDTASLTWRELVILGRSDEASGALTLAWRVERAGRPLLRQSVDLDSAPTRSWSGMAAGRRVMACALISRPGLEARTVVARPTAVAQTLDAHSSLITVVDDDAASAARQLDELCAEVLAARPGPAGREFTDSSRCAGG